MEEIIIATNNKGKAAEFKSFFSNYNVQAKALPDLSTELPDVEETGTTFEENAALKAEQIAEITNTPVLADDSGLMIDALDGRPGIHSARYAGEHGNDQKNIDKVMDELKDVTAEARTARFISVLAIAVPGSETIFRTGCCEGAIALKQAGTHGFGYDPIFTPKGYERTMAQLSPDEKNEISHRKHAMDKLADWIRES